MGKQNCSYCFEFYRKTCGQSWGKNRVEVPGCTNCHSRHEGEVYNLQEKVKSLELEIEQKKEFYETEQSSLLAKMSGEFRKLQKDYEKILSELKLNSSLEISKLKADNSTQRKKVQFLQVRRDSLHGDVVLAVPGLQITAHRILLYYNRNSSFKSDVNNLLKADYLNQPARKFSEILSRTSFIEEDSSKQFKAGSLTSHQVVVDLGYPVCWIISHYSSSDMCRLRSHPFSRKVVPESAEKQSTKVINIDEVAPAVLEAMVDFCYSGEIVFSELVAPDEVLKAAHTFELRLLMEYCDEELCRRLTVDNVPQMLKLSRKFDAKKLQEAAWKVFKEHFDTLRSMVCDVLEGPDSSTPFSQSSQAAGPEWNEQSNEVSDLGKFSS